MLPHTNIGVLEPHELARLREVTASQGLMLESVDEWLMETVHAGSPTKHPARRLATIEAAGQLKIPFTSGILVGIGETEEARVESLEALAALHEKYGHLQEVILQNFVPHPRYYGAEVAEIADQASRARWAGRGCPAGRQRGGPAGVIPTARPAGGLSAGVGDPWHRGDQAPDRGVPAADAGRRGAGAAEPVGVLAGAGRGGGDRPGRAVRQRRPHLARGAVPEPAPGAQGAGAAGVRADRAALRLPAVHGSRVDGAGGARRDQAEVLELHPAARFGAALGGDDPGGGGRAGDRQGARGGGAERGRADGAVRRDPARGDRGDAGGGRRAAGRAARRAGHLRRQPQHQLHQHLRRRLRLLRLRPGQALARRLRGQRGGLRGADRARRSSSAPPSSACRAASTPT